MITFCKTELLVLVLFFLQCSAHAQQRKEEAPSPEFVEQLENLSMAKSQDTALENTILTMKAKNYYIPTYELSKKFNKPVSGVSESGQKLNDLIKAKFHSAYKVLTLFKNLRDTANYLCKNDFNFGTSQAPLQHKIAYSWGSKDFTKRQRPPGEGDNCAYTIYGLDCSGFIYQLFKRNNIKLPVAQCNANTERTTTFLMRYLRPYFGTSAFEVKDLGPLFLNEIQSGDIIYFKTSLGHVYHIGILFVNDSGQVVFYQSLGQPNRKTNNDQICQTNLNDFHGPVIKILTEDFLKGCKKNYGCVRIIGTDVK